MEYRSTWMRYLSAAMLTLMTAAALAQEPMRYIYNAPESDSDTRYTYQWKILETALEKTRRDYGAFVLQASPPMSERRQAVELMSNSGRLTVMYQTPTPELDRNLEAVRIPVDRDLVGYRVFLIRKQDRARFADIKSLDELKQFRFGQGLDWIDVGILRASGLNVVTGSSYEGLFEMLENSRFDVFLRGAVEVIEEYELRRKLLPDIEIEPDLALYYPQPMYFWFPKTPAGMQLAQRVETGMRRMLADGSYDQLFSEYQDDKIRRLDLAHRRIIRIDNPNLGPDAPFADKRLWFDPHSYRPRNTGAPAP